VTNTRGAAARRSWCRSSWHEIAADAFREVIGARIGSGKESGLSGSTKSKPLLWRQPRGDMYSAKVHHCRRSSCASWLSWADKLFREARARGTQTGTDWLVWARRIVHVEHARKRIYPSA
jgi:hypothetical protein